MEVLLSNPQSNFVADITRLFYIERKSQMAGVAYTFTAGGRMCPLGNDAAGFAIGYFADKCF
jgi:hypothetical protein